jgi:hypothetical protein
MPVYDDPLTSLTARARGGDSVALAGLRDELEPRITRVVQQVMRIGPGGSALDRKIARELALSARTHPDGSRDGQALATQVARRVCAAVLAGLRAPSLRPEGLRDTVRGL